MDTSNGVQVLDLTKSRLSADAVNGTAKLFTARVGKTVPKTHWQELAANYDNVLGQDPAMHALYETILNELPPAPQAVLDLGTGTGKLLQLVRYLYPDCWIVGLDPSPAMLEQAREKLGDDPLADYILGSAHQIELPDNSFDAVISNFALHHLSHPDKQICAHEIFRVLKPGGRLVYGDQHCRIMGTPDDPDWVEDIFDLYCHKALHYLRTASLNRMLLQVKLLPKFITADGEIPATVEYWETCLKSAGLQIEKIIDMQPATLCNSVIVALKP